MILKGDCVEVMKAMKPNSIDAIVTDPPYGLEFMGKEWDKLNRHVKPRANQIYPKSRNQNGVKIASDKNNMILAQSWHTTWLTEAICVLKPGGSLLAMGGTRTFHRLACAMEDAGFIIKDCLMWLYGSGFPKAQDLGKMIDKAMGAERKQIGTKIGLPGYSLAPERPDGTRGNVYEYSKSGSDPNAECAITAPATDLACYWDGWKVGSIKPAYEPILWAIKPPEGSYMNNALKWGVGAVNVEECRVGSGQSSPGRFPANVILDEEAGRLLDEQSGDRKTTYISKHHKNQRGISIFPLGHPGRQGFNDSGGASRFFYCPKASRKEREMGMEGAEKQFLATMGDGIGKREHNQSEQNAWVRNNHPTV